MGPAPRTLSLLPLLILLFTLLLPLSAASEPLVEPRQADCTATTCTACLGSNVQCAWCYSSSKEQQCYNTVTGTCDGLTQRYSCVQEVRIDLALRPRVDRHPGRVLSTAQLW